VVELYHESEGRKIAEVASELGPDTGEDRRTLTGDSAIRSVAVRRPCNSLLRKLS
jgi:hypothetical protein